MKRLSRTRITAGGLLWAMLGATLGVAACVGEIGDPGDDPLLNSPNEKVGQAQPGNWTTRRLTKDQYAYTVQDVLGVNLSAEQLALLPDEARADGFSNNVIGLVVTSDHADGFFNLAEQVVESVPDWNALLADHSSCQDLGDTNCEESFVGSLGQKMFRRPLDSGEISRFRLLFDAAAQEDLGYPDGAKLVMEAMLQAPQFLYQLEDESHAEDGVRLVAGYEMASRLSYLIWQSAPDETLYQAAADGLDTPEAVLEQTNRMLGKTALAQRTTARFVRDWFGLDALNNTEREGLSGEMAQQLLLAAEATYQQHVWEQRLPITDVLTTQSAELPAFAAEWYSLSSAGDGINSYDLSGVPERVGILTHPGVVTAISDRDVGGIVARGLFVMEHLLCREALNPPADLNTSAFTSHLGPDATERDYSEDRMDNDSCRSCHVQFDPYAYALERFDGIGRYALKSDADQPLRSDGAIVVDDGTLTPFETVAEYSDLLGASAAVQHCVTRKHLQFALGVSSPALEKSVDAVHAAFLEQGGSYEAMVRAIVTQDVFRNTPAEAE